VRRKSDGFSTLGQCLCCLGLLGWLVLPCLGQSPNHSLAELQKQADAFLGARQFPEAIDSYRQVLNAAPENEKATIGLARAYEGVYNHDEARRLLRESSGKHPKSALALIELGRLDIKLLHYDQAIEDLHEALRREPTSAAAHLDLGIAYQAKGETDKARVEFDQAIKRDPRSASSYYFRGMLLADTDENDLAYADASKSHELDPAALQARVLLAKVATRLHKCDQAVALLKPLVDDAGSEIENLYLLSRAYQCAGEAELARQAQEDFERHSKLAETDRTRKMDADHLALQAEQFARNNQLAPALAALSQALEKDPTNGAAHAALAKIEFSRGNVKKANTEIEAALNVSPYNPDYLYVLGKVLAKQGNSKGALDAFQKTVLVDPRESDAYYEMAEIYAAEGNHAGAVENMRMAVKLSPEDAEYKRALEELQKQR
jgi:tetratricopeptide (TPR) repeat protein